MKAYVLRAEGALAVLNGPQQILCSKVFANRDTAEAYIPEFRRKCVTPLDDKDMWYLLDNDRLKIAILELEYVP